MSHALQLLVLVIFIQVPWINHVSTTPPPPPKKKKKKLINK